MDRIRFLTAGESHGKALACIIEGLPSGLELSEKDIEKDLRRRQRGYGRGDRQKIEKDRAKILSGVRYGLTLGSPVALLLENKDWPNWTQKMSVHPVEQPAEPLYMPRPGHADFAGMVKYRQSDLRNILERSSARETAMRVAAGAIARKFLSLFGVKIYGHVTKIGGIGTDFSAMQFLSGKQKLKEWDERLQLVEKSPIACVDTDTEKEIIKRIDQAAKEGDSLGGSFEIVATGVPVGLGSHTHWDRRLDGRIAAAMMSINAMKAVEIGMGTSVADIPGSQVHDEIFYDEQAGYYRKSNGAGGVEGGMTNGEPVVVRVFMKPLPTLTKPLQSIDTKTRNPRKAFRERSDVCAVPAAAVVGEAMLALVLANALMEKIGGDSTSEMIHNFKALPYEPLGW